MKKDWIIVLFLLLGPILDVTSFYGFSFSIYIRGIFFGGMVLSLLIKKQSIPYLISFLSFGVLLFGYQYFYLKFGLFSVLSAILKFLYLPVAILYFQTYFFLVEKRKVLTIILFTYLSIFLLSYVLGIGADAYLETDGKSGFKGLFSSINEFSAIVVSLLFVSVSFFKERKQYCLLGLVLFLSFLCSLLIGTKVLLGGILFCILYLLWQERDFLFLSRSRKGKTVILVFCLGSCLVLGYLFTKTRTYQNMVVQQNFFQVQQVLSIDFVNRIIYNDRLTFLKDNFDYFKKQDIPQILLGIGLDNYDVKMVEIDVFDILFRYGILGFGIFMGSILLPVQWKKISRDFKIAIFLLISISLTAGHVLFYPAVSIYYALFLSNQEEKGVGKRNRD